MLDTRALFDSLVGRLARRARQDLVVRRCVAGLFFGLLPGAAAAVCAGSVALPIPALLLAAATAAAGCAAGLVSALTRPVDRRRLLIAADRTLGSRELAGTALELARAGGTGASAGAFSEAVIEDAVDLLSRTAPRSILGRLRARLAPFTVLAALVTTAAFLFPFDVRALFPGHNPPDIAQIGEDLRNRGLRLAEEARAHDFARSLALSQELAQLGSDLAARRIQAEDALDRMSELESGLAEEYRLRIQEAQSQLTSDKGLNDLGDTLDRLREAQRQLDARRNGGERGVGERNGDKSASGGVQARSPSRQRGGSPGSQTLPPGGGSAGQAQGRNGGSDSGAGEGAETPGQSGGAGGSGVGTLPAPVKRGAPSDVIDGTNGPNLQAQGNAVEGDSTRMLVRSLPRLNGSRLPEKAILNGYSRQAESAFARDEVPLKLREYVKQYFTVIGISKQVQ